MVLTYKDTEFQEAGLNYAFQILQSVAFSTAALNIKF